MNTSARRIFLGIALILLGGLFLLQQIFHLPIHLGSVIVAMAFILAGLAFIFVLLNNRRENWWAAIPGLVLLGLGALIATSEFFPGFANHFGGSLFLAQLGWLFLSYCWSDRMPGGLLSRRVCFSRWQQSQE